MLDVTTSGNLEDRRAMRPARRAKPFSLRRSMPALGGGFVSISRYAGMGLAFSAAAIVCAAMGFFLLRPGAPKPAAPARSSRAQTAHVDAMVKEILDRPLFSGDRSPA